MNLILGKTCNLLYTCNPLALHEGGVSQIKPGENIWFQILPKVHYLCTQLPLFMKM